MKRPEQDLQILAVQMIRLAAPDLMFWHTPNGGGRSKVEASILKAMGTLPGVPDLTFILPNGTPAFIEMKARKGVLTPGQKAFRDDVRARGLSWQEARTLTEVWDILDGWLRPWGWSLKVQRPIESKAA